MSIITPGVRVVQLSPVEAMLNQKLDTLIGLVDTLVLLSLGLSKDDVVKIKGITLPTYDPQEDTTEPPGSPEAPAGLEADLGEYV